MKQRSRIFAILIATNAFLLLAPVARAVTLMTIADTVRDSLLRGIPGVTVSDGRQAVVTGQDGKYAIDESVIANYAIRTTGRHVNAASCLVTPTDALAPVDFQLTASFNAYY